MNLGNSIDDISNIRRNYKLSSLRRKDLNTDPFKQFSLWMTESIKADLLEPNAMVLSTCFENKPTSRSVLLKCFDQRGFIFYTNYKSRKSEQINSQPNVSLLFPWFEIERQVIINGPAKKITAKESKEYFDSRPIKSKIGAWVSKQSSVIESRKVLEEKLESVTSKFTNREINVPDFWGGYLVKPVEFEFWQGRENRLHDRFRYSNRKENDNSWTIERLSP